MFPSARYVVVGNMDRRDEGGPMLGLREMGWGELMETPRSLGAVIKMASRVEMRKHARHSGLIEDAPLPTWRIHYL